MRHFWAVLLVALPASLRLRVARSLLGWDVHPSAYIGRSVIRARKVVLAEGASIGSLNIFRGLDELRLGRGASIGTRNVVSAHPLAAQVFTSPKRKAMLLLGEFAMITVAHEIDCSDRVELADYAVLAGFKSQILTHSLDLVRDKWVTAPIQLGERCAVMSGCILLNGVRIPARSIVSAGSVVTTPLIKEQTFYRGNPAQAVRPLPDTLKYFARFESPPGRSA